MARGGGQIQYGYHPSAANIQPQIPPWVALLQAASAGFGAYQQADALGLARQSDQAQLEQTRNDEMRRQAEERQAFARLAGQLGDPATGPLDPGTQSQVGSVMGGIGDARQKVNMDAKFAEAKPALAAVTQRRSVNVAMREIDRMLAEMGGKQPTSAPDGARTPVTARGGDPLLTGDQDARVRSALETMRAQIQANPESATQLSDLAVQLGVDPQGRIKMAAAEEDIVNSRNRRESDEQATQVLKSLAPEFFGTFNGPIFGAGEYLRDEIAYRRQRDLDTARATAAAGLEEKRHRNALEEGRANSFEAAYTSAFQMFYAKNAEANPNDALQLAQNEAEAYLRRRGFQGEVQALEPGRRAQLAQFGRAATEAIKYTQELLSNHAQTQLESVDMRADLFQGRSNAAQLGNALTPQMRRTTSAPRPLTERDMREFKAALAVRLRTQLGVDEATAQLALEYALVDDQFRIFNEDLQEQRNSWRGRSSRESIGSAIGRSMGAALPGVDPTQDEPLPQFELRAGFMYSQPLPPATREGILSRLRGEQFRRSGLDTTRAPRPGTPTNERPFR